MPFIHSKVSIPMSQEQETKLKEKLGQAISLIPGKSEGWLMLDFDSECHMYFRGENTEPMAMVSVSVFGQPDSSAFQKLTAKITDIFQEILHIAPDHIYIKYDTTKDWGWNGSNF